jgi:hypothetical protein
MNEATKTITFLGVAVAAVLLAVVTRPSTADYDVSSEKGKTFEKFDPEQPKRMKIVKFDEPTATLREFEVAENDDGLWSIPSKGGYPADAEQQMGEAVTGVMDREILDVASTSAADHEQFGVVDPLSSKIEVGQTGVGTRVTLSDGTGDSLVDMIIGKPVKDTTGQYYVRKPSQDPVYVIEVNPEDFSTKFEDWIEPDLLKLNSFDVKQVTLNDYSAAAELVPTEQGLRLGLREDRRDKLTLTYDEKSGEWQAKDLQTFDKASDAYKPFSLQDDQVLSDEALRELKNALDDLRIVDVDRKPAGLSANLRAGQDFLQDEQALQSLVPRGFIPVAVGPEEVEILSSEGEVIATLKDGVEYVLRFGELKLSRDGEAEAAKPEDASEQPADEEAKDEEGVNRYLFVMARFNENAVEKPVLEDLPKLPEGAEDEKVETEQSESEAEGQQPEGETSEEKEGEDASEEESSTEKSEDQKSTEDEVSSEDESAKKLKEVIAQRKAIEKENQRKLDEYEKTLTKGRERVKELNDRFGDWYYVISNDVFKKVHLGREQVITVKQVAEGETPEAATGPNLPFGAPGTAIPGLPTVPGAEERPADEAEVPESPAEAEEALTDAAEEAAAGETEDPQ